jgi:hypothetical protein
METKQIENLATNVLRFVTLLLFAAGVLAGMGTHFLLDYLGTGMIAEAALVALICIVVAIAFVWMNKISPNPTALARLMTLRVFVVAFIASMGASILIGMLLSEMLVLLLFVVVIVWGLWVFRKRGE